MPVKYFVADQAVSWDNFFSCHVSVRLCLTNGQHPANFVKFQLNLVLVLINAENYGSNGVELRGEDWIGS